MRRSDINALLREAAAFFAAHQFALPPWAAWSPEEWAAHPAVARYCAARQMGWDVTDFGSGDFPRRGLVLFCLRNGIAGVPGEAPYAEKLMMVREGQETPWHWHRVKMEDIIVRGGGSLAVEVFSRTADGRRGEGPVIVHCDGMAREVAPGEPILLAPGQSITIPRGLAHRFYGAPSTGTVLVGEVSQVNDDHADNVFLEELPRFAAIEEDEPPLHPLWNEVAA
ncbi:D-lyxose/D-mannose family sugar isomerase [Chelatococcus composti]|jgi:D-lyxose ketol-isomerase|uniref:D-lyxose ketol-isomerase n=1 Tax=Chelatococcus composti TaxID=1743235 RepID=A0A841KBE6_9HYPH|nr:D-lyxose/D-mannose family sugar isomerase [Chelatococcus composti]MBB6167326.1 hypothetical protein [Chelatococcus composti]MBS7735533.1 D-lyxose/D-mannose family sugar isomerase [Chelatococcus composti]GGG31018.1 hypothetical protein GCM10008026_09420 [Chelatococcus composti]